MRLHAIAASAALSLAACATPTTSPYLTDDPNVGYNNFLQTQQLAQTSAIRAGDDKLTCQQLEAEFIALENDPAIAAAMASAESNAGTQGGVVTAMQGQMAVNNALAAAGAAGALQLPGSDVFTLMAAKATEAHVDYQSAVSQSALAGSLNSLGAVQDVVMRQQRVGELATDKNCAFINAIN